MAITKEEALSLNVFHDNATPQPNRKGACYEWRRNGATKTWKRDPERFEVPVKYGLREYGTISATNNSVHVPFGPECPMREGA